MPARPDILLLGDHVYSNFDHVLQQATVEKLLSNPKVCAQHAAWNFCGYVWFDGQTWREDVWVYGACVEKLSGASCEEVIQAANELYGSK